MKRIRVNCQTEQGEALAELSKLTTMSIDKLGRMAIDAGLPKVRELVAPLIAANVKPVAAPSTK